MLSRVSQRLFGLRRVPESLPQSEDTVTVLARLERDCHPHQLWPDAPLPGRCALGRFESKVPPVSQVRVVISSLGVCDKLVRLRALQLLHLDVEILVPDSRVEAWQSTQRKRTRDFASRSVRGTQCSL